MGASDAERTALRRAIEQIKAGEREIIIPIGDEAPLGPLARDIEGLASQLAQERMQQQLDDRMAAYAELGAGITHEVKNPMTGIIGFAQVGKKKAENTDKARQLFSMIEEQAQRCTDVVRRFLAFARGGERNQRSTVLGDVLTEVSDVLGHQLQMSDVQLRLELADDVPLVLADPGELHQVLLNLLLNAQQAMPDGGRVKLQSARSDDGMAVVRVTDDGPGMPPEVRARIFEPFFTTKRADQGTGLGLAISHGIIKSHGGRLTVASEVGIGTTFTITLPPLEEANERAPRPASGDEGGEVAGSFAELGDLLGERQ